jgi:hypothetical protein
MNKTITLLENKLFIVDLIYNDVDIGILGKRKACVYSLLARNRIFHVIADNCSEYLCLLLLLL